MLPKTFQQKQRVPGLTARFGYVIYLKDIWKHCSFQHHGLHKSQSVWFSAAILGSAICLLQNIFPHDRSLPRALPGLLLSGTRVFPGLWLQGITSATWQWWINCSQTVLSEFKGLSFQNRIQAKPPSMFHKHTHAHRNTHLLHSPSPSSFHLKHLSA